MTRAAAPGETDDKLKSRMPPSKIVAVPPLSIRSSPVILPPEYTSRYPPDPTDVFEATPPLQTEVDPLEKMLVFTAVPPLETVALP